MRAALVDGKVGLPRYLSVKRDFLGGVRVNRAGFARPRRVCGASVDVKVRHMRCGHKSMVCVSCFGNVNWLCTGK